MALLITPLRILIAVAALGLYGAYGVWIAISEHSWISALAGAVALVASVATAMLKPWSRFLVYALAVAVVGTWLYSLYDSARAGYFSLYSPSQIAWQLAPGIFLVLLSGCCAYAVFRQFRARPRT